MQSASSRMNLPQRLRDAGVAESDLPRLAEIAFHMGNLHHIAYTVSRATYTQVVSRLNERGIKNTGNIDLWSRPRHRRTKGD